MQCLYTIQMLFLVLQEKLQNLSVCAVICITVAGKGCNQGLVSKVLALRAI